MTVLFQARITPGSLCNFEIPIPEDETFINVTGTLQWAEEKENGFTGGVALTEILDDDTFRKLLSGYTPFGETSDSECPQNMQVQGEETCSFPRNIPSSKKAFIALCFFIFLLSLPLIVMAVRGYSSGKSCPHDQTVEGVVLKTTKLPPVTVEPAPVISGPPALPVETAIKEEPVATVLKTSKLHHIARLKDNGGSFYSLALRHYQRANETIFDLIVQANPAITNLRRISDEKKIVLPVITPSSYLEKVDDGTYRVYIGTFETFERATAFSKKVGTPEKLFSIKAHQFSPQDTWYRLTMGDYNDKRDALETAKLLKESGLIYISPEVEG